MYVNVGLTLCSLHHHHHFSEA